MDKTSWNERTQNLYADRLKENNDPMMNVWYRKMSQKSKEAKTLSYKEIDQKTDELYAKGYRIVKSSALTPKSRYNLQNFQDTQHQNFSPAADTLFFELPVDGQDFENMYKVFGMFYNNFPDYFQNKDDFRKYAAKSDIWIIEDINTNKPVGFSTYNMITEASPDAAEYKADYEFDKTLLYHDTIALSPELQGKGVGRLVNDIIDGYYLQYFGKNIDYGLCTGEINTAENGKLSNRFHINRGYDITVKEEQYPLSKWVKRYENIARQDETYRQQTGKPISEMPLSTVRSYHSH